MANHAEYEEDPGENGEYYKLSGKRKTASHRHDDHNDRADEEQVPQGAQKPFETFKGEYEAHEIKRERHYPQKRDRGNVLQHVVGKREEKCRGRRREPEPKGPVGAR